jgi:hypothetical protein
MLTVTLYRIASRYYPRICIEIRGFWSLTLVIIILLPSLKIYSIEDGFKLRSTTLHFPLISSRDLAQLKDGYIKFWANATAPLLE